MSNLLLFPDLFDPGPPEAAAPPPAPLAPADAAEREQALDTGRSFLVEAPAGSGKTGLLIQRLLKLLAGPDVTDPAQVLAITFTRKATGELRERVLHQLSAAAAGAPPANPFDAVTRTLAEAVLARDHALGWNLLAQPGRLNISTIDSVCARIAHALPVLAGAGADLSPTEMSAPLHAEAARRTLLRLGGPDPELSHAIELLLLHRDGSLGDLEGHIASMLATREQWGDLIPRSLGPDGEPAPLDDARLEAEVLPRLEQALDRAICRTLTQTAKAMPPELLDALSALAAQMGHAEGHNGNASPLAFCAGQPQPPGEAAAHLDHWRALASLLLKKDGDWRKRLSANDLHFTIAREHSQELKSIIEQMQHHDATASQLQSALCAVQALPSPVYPPEQWLLAKALFRILGQALADLAAIFREREACDFTEPALIARAALASPLAGDDLEAASGSRLRHLLVDEMQDTSSGQYELIELLTRGWGAAGETVLLVGDPKQSIYLFRQARVERFLHTLAKGRLGTGGLPLDTLRLSANFRSCPDLVESFNDDFRRIFPATPDPAHPEDVTFYPATASRAALPRPATQTVPHSSAASPRMSGLQPQAPEAAVRQWHTSALPYVKDAETRQARRQASRDLDASAICDLIRDWQSRPLPPERAARDQPWRLAVLVRGRNHVFPVVEALRAAQIPYRAIDIDPLAERQEVLDLIALTRALLHPADRTAWLALLRAPWCGLKLADLHTIAGSDDDHWAKRTVLDAIRERAALLSADGQARLAPFAQVIERALPLTGRMTLSAWVEHTWRALTAPACASAEELANADRFFSLLDALDAGATAAVDLKTLEERLRRLYAAPSLSPGAVEITTIHAAKGLEWDVVMVPSLDHAAPPPRGRLLDWLELDPDGDPLAGEPLSLLAPIQAKGRDTNQLNTWMRGLLSAREAAERKRLFYVVSTRAREELHLFAAPFARAKGGIFVPSLSLLKAAWPAAESFFEAQSFEARPLAEILEMPPPVDAPLSIAAAAAVSIPAPVLLERIPQPAILTPEAAPAAAPAQSPAHRPEGSFATRILGNTLHTLLDHLATRLADARSPQAMLAEVRGWTPRIRALLLSNGLGTAELTAATTTVLRGLENTLAHPDGQWVMAPHTGAGSERATVGVNERGTYTVRLDRTFLAGAAPHAPGDSHRWIIDIKTGTHGPKGLETWLTQQRELYTGQLERYAAALAEPGQPVRLGLYFPMVQRLLWWKWSAPAPSATASVSPAKETHSASASAS